MLQCLENENVKGLGFKGESEEQSIEWHIEGEVRGNIN